MTASEPATTATSTVASPTLPPAAQTADVAGAEAFIRYYIDTVNYAYASGDVDVLNETASEACAACISVKQSIQDAYADGDRLTGGAIHPGEITVTPGDASEGLEAAVIVEQDPAERLAQDGTVTEAIPATPRNLYRFILKYTDRWTIVQWGNFVQES